MSWKEIMMAINSDIRTPLNKLIERVLDKLDNISTGGGTGSSGSKPFYTSDFIKTITNNPSVSTLPYDFYYGSAVVYNNEIHILGDNSSSYRTKHYKWNGTSWTSVSTLPYDFYKGSAVVYNNEIHILGSSSGSYRTAHYKWNGTSWTSVSTLPYIFNTGSAVVYNNEIHILGGDSSAKHYKWNGTSWTSSSTLPYEFYNSSAVVYNNEIHILGGDSSSYQTNHRKLISIYIYKSFLPSGVVIYFYDDFPVHSITEKTNCTKQSDNSILVNSDGLVEFEIKYIEVEEDNIKYAIF